VYPTPLVSKFECNDRRSFLRIFHYSANRDGKLLGHVGARFINLRVVTSQKTGIVFP
jgi:hypothetical protein